MSSVAATAPAPRYPEFHKNSGAIKSEDKIPTALDKCLADGMIKAGSGLVLGSALSLVLFRRRMWPITLGVGLGMGMALSNCQSNLNSD